MSTVSGDTVKNPGAARSSGAGDHCGAALQLISGLRDGLAAGDLELPALPSVVTLIQRALDRSEVQIAQICELILSEPALAGSVLKLANSPIYRRGGIETTNMDTCVQRLGTRLVHSVSLHFAMQQMQRAPEYKAIHSLLEPEWDRSRMVSELCYSLARRSRRAAPEDMLTLGLIHNIGRIYILGQAGSQARAMFEDEDAAALIEEWHPLIGGAIAKSWHLPESAVRAIAEQGDEDAPNDDDVRTLLVLAITIATQGVGEDGLDPALVAEFPGALRLGLDAGPLGAIIEDAREFGEMLMGSSSSVQFL